MRPKIRAIHRDFTILGLRRTRQNIMKSHLPVRRYTVMECKKARFIKIRNPYPEMRYFSPVSTCILTLNFLFVTSSAIILLLPLPAVHFHFPYNYHVYLILLTLIPTSISTILSNVYSQILFTAEHYYYINSRILVFHFQALKFINVTTKILIFLPYLFLSTCNIFSYSSNPADIFPFR